RGTRVSVLGAGGAARAVVAGLHAEGAAVVVHARQAAQADTVAALGARSGPWPPLPGTWDLLVNTTPVGTWPRVEESPLPAAALGGGRVYDLVYNPAETRLMREARAAGCEAIGGLEMLIAQAMEQFEWWTGERPSEKAMRAAAEARLEAMHAEDGVTDR
ncbi:MAG: shikimate dehydrogenase family protein, partial [Vicinamibacteria bacterium]